MMKVRKIAMPVPYNEKKIEYIRQQESEEKGKKIRFILTKRHGIFGRIDMLF